MFPLQIYRLPGSFPPHRPPPLPPGPSWPTFLRGKPLRPTHRVAQSVPPGLPQLTVPAVVEAVGAGELVPRVPDVASLSPDHSQEGQPAQIHLDSKQATSVPSYLSDFDLRFSTTPVMQRKSGAQTWICRFDIVSALLDLGLKRHFRLNVFAVSTNVTRQLSS